MEPRLTMPMSPSFQQEEFSRAYVHAVAAVAGAKVFPPSAPDDDSVDLSIGTRGPYGMVRSPRMDVQLKSWRGTVAGDELSFVLPAKNYEDLRHENYMVPRILVVVVVPDSPSEWISQGADELVLRRCGYWLSLRGMAETINSTSVTIKIPASNVFSVEALVQLLHEAGGSAP